MVHTEATLNGLNNPNLIKLVLQLESEVNSDVKYSERQSSCKDSPQVLRIRKDLKSLNLTEGTRIFRNEIVCAYYRDLQNKCKKLNVRNSFVGNSFACREQLGIALIR